MFGKWSYSNFSPEDRGDWTYETARGLLSNGLVRKNIGVTFDHVYTFNSTTIFNWSVAWNRFIEGSASNEVQTSFPPSSVGSAELHGSEGRAVHSPAERGFQRQLLQRFHARLSGLCALQRRHAARRVVQIHRHAWPALRRRPARQLARVERAGQQLRATSASTTPSCARRRTRPTRSDHRPRNGRPLCWACRAALSISTNDDLYLTEQILLRLRAGRLEAEQQADRQSRSAL